MKLNFLRAHTPRVNFINVNDAVKSRKEVFEQLAKKRRVNLRISQNEVPNVKGMDSYMIYATKPSEKGNTGYAAFCAPKDQSIEKLMVKMNEAIQAAVEWVRPFGTLKDRFLSLF